MLKFLICLIPVVFYGQVNVTGRVIDSTSKPISGVNILLFNLENNFIQDGTITNLKGEFKFSNLEKGPYRVEFSYIGYGIEYREFTLLKNISLGNVELNEVENELDEVVLSAKRTKPLIEMQIDRSIFNISQSDAAIGGNTVDALRITPGIKIKRSSIEIAGKGSVKIMVDDRLLRLDEESALEYLKSIPANQIDRIEIITNPPSKYTAEGNFGLINIVLKEGETNQFYGVITGSIRKGKKISNNENISIFYNENKLQINGGLNYYNYRYDIFQNRNVFYTNYALNERNNWISNRIGIGGFLEADLKISEITNIGFNARYNKYPDNRVRSTIFSDFSSDMKVDSTLITKTLDKSISENHNYSLYLDHKLDTLGSKITSELSYTNNDREKDINSSTSKKSNSDVYDLSSNNNRNIYLFFAALDVELIKGVSNYGFGFQFSNSQTDNVSTYISPNLEDQNNNFHYKENIYALYFSTFQEINNKLSIKLGLRSEYTESEGVVINSANTTNRYYLQFFPSAYLNYNFNDDNSLILSYGRRIDRPSYSYLDPFRYYNSQYSYLEGNPYLRPAYNNNIELKHLYKNKLSSTFYFNYTPNKYGRINIVSANSQTIATVFDNYLETFNWGLGETFYFKPTSWWESDNTARIYYSVSKSQNPNTLSSLSGFGAFLSSNNSIVLNEEKTLRSYLNFVYYFPEVNGVQRDETYYYLDFGLTALFFSKNLTISFDVEDVLKTAYNRTRTIINGINQNMEAYYDSRALSFSVSYKFGNSKNKNQRGVYDDNSSRID